jgi:sugar lactone lactonase YvrE
VVLIYEPNPIFKDVSVLNNSHPITIVKDVIFPESPRWYDNKLWFSDIFGQAVLTVDLDGHSGTVRRFDDRPSGIGFLP